MKNILSQKIRMGEWHRNLSFWASGRPRCKIIENGMKTCNLERLDAHRRKLTKKGIKTHLLFWAYGRPVPKLPRSVLRPWKTENSPDFEIPTIRHASLRMDGSYEWVVSILAIWKVAITGWDSTWAIRVLVKCSLKQTLSRFVTCATLEPQSCEWYQKAFPLWHQENSSSFKCWWAPRRKWVQNWGPIRWETEQRPTPSPNRIENVSFATLVRHL